MDWLTLGLFCLGLILCLVTGTSILWALGAGLASLFEARRRSVPPR